MSMDKETKNKVREYFTSKKFIVMAGIFLLAIGTAAATAANVNRQLRENLTNLVTEEVLTEKPSENAANDVTGVTVEKTEKTTEEVSVVKEGKFIYPAGKKIIKDYSGSVAVKSKTMNDWRVHSGIDFHAEEGQEIKAVQSGAVLAVYNSSLWGTIVEIDHGAGIVARYCGLDKELKVSANDVLEAGQVIGYISSIPVEAADGIHLHLEVTKDGAITDPLSLFEQKSLKQLQGCYTIVTLVFLDTPAYF